MPDATEDAIRELRTSLSELARRLDSTLETSKLEITSFRALLNEQIAAKDIRVDLLKNEIRSLRAHNDDLYKQNIETLKGMNAAFEKHDASFTSQSEAVNKQHMDMLRGLTASFERHNDALQRQIGFRFNFVTSMLGVVGLVLTATLVYNKIQVDDLEKQRGLMEQSRRKYDESNENLTKSTAVFSSVLSALAEANGLISDGHREYKNAAYIDAQYFSTAAIRLLETAFDRTGVSLEQFRNYRFDSSLCVTGASPAIPTTQTGLSEALRTAVRTSLVEAYDLRNRARLFLLANKRGPQFGSYDDIQNDGEFLISLNPKGWEGYHWVGLVAALAAAQQSTGREKFDQAHACYQQSIRQKRTSNKDSLNLVELLFTNGKFPEAQETVATYLRDLQSPIDKKSFLTDGATFVSTIEAVGHFYLTAANHLSANPDNSILEPDDYIAQWSKRDPQKFEGTFIPEVLKKYIESKKFTEQDVTDKRKVEKVTKMKQCILGEIKC